MFFAGSREKKCRRALFADDAMTRIGRLGSNVARRALHTLARVLAMLAAYAPSSTIRVASRPRVRDARAVVARATRPGDRRRDDSRSSSRSSNNAVPYRRRVPLIDYYAVLDVPPDSSPDEIRAAWRALQKSVHPDLAGDHAAAAAALVNEAVEILTCPSHRASFDADRDDWLAHGANDDLALMDPTPLSAWSGPDPREPAGARGRHDAAFVDESRCVGCLKCALHAPETFHVETRFGKARVVNQWADGRDAVEDAVDACPVRCIHFVDRVAELPLLERVAARQWKEGGTEFGGQSASPFDVAASLRRRAARPGGIAPWPSRRRRGGSNRRPNGGGGDASRVDSSAANAAVAAAVAAEAAAAADAWAETAKPNAPPTNANHHRTTEKTTEKKETERSVVVSAQTLRNDHRRTFDGVRTASGGVWSSANAARSSFPSPDVARVQSLLDANPNENASAFSDEFAAEYWIPIPESERAASSSFEESDDGGFAPTEWIQNIRKSRAGAAVENENEKENENASAGASAGASGSGSCSGSGRTRFEGPNPRGASSSSFPSRYAAGFEPTTAGSPRASADPAAVVGAAAALAAAISATTGNDVAASEAATLVAAGRPAEWLASPWVAWGCATAAWTVVISAADAILRAVEHLKRPEP